MVPQTPPISFDRVASVYDRTRGLPPAVEEQVQLRLLERLGSSRTLEVGVGTGRHFSGLLSNPALDLTGVDVSRKMLQVALGRGARRVLLADGRLLPFRDASFERAITSHLLHLSAEWPRILSELARVARVEYLSVVEFTKDLPDIDEAYLTRAEAAGCRARAPGLGERKLTQQLPPDAEVEISKVDYSVPLDDRLRELETRSFFGQWAVPDPVHARIMRELRREHGGSEIHTQLRVALVAWSILRIRDFAEAQGATGRGPLSAEQPV
jgi:SAM-dependent methyltransferase